MSQLKAKDKHQSLASQSEKNPQMQNEYELQKNQWKSKVLCNQSNVRSEMTVFYKIYAYNP